MAKTLIIAEKPSVATDLARALGKLPGMTAFHKEKDYFENDSHVISSAVGHLLELKMPEVNGKKIGWGFTTLPIIPEHFDLQPIQTSADRFRALTKLIKRKDIEVIVNACDAGREGELIFRYLMEATGCTKPIKRLWMQSMTNSAILEAFKQLRSDDEMRPLYDAAKCRSESDWIVGINGTRALTALNSRHGGFRLTPVGRVQTPTLSILAAREHAIMDFVPREYFEVHGLFEITAGRYPGRWFNEQFQKDEADEHKKAERIWDRAHAEAIVARCVGKPGKVSEVTKPARQGAPLLYDLTSLQRDASNRFGFSARRTLQIAQALYEKYKVLTYPRTDSRYLPEDYLGTCIGTMKTFAGHSDSKHDAFPFDLIPHAAKVMSNHWIRPNRRIFDNSKVSDHFAIIPTGQIPPKELPEAEQKIFDMVLRRFIAVFFPPAEFEVTTRITRVGEDAFKSEGKVLKESGWLAVYGKKAAEEAAAEGESGGKLLTPYSDGENASTLDVELREETTKPPPRYNEATLLSTMENAGKFVEDEDHAEAMSERGLGTPATRAAIIEGLIMDGYIERNQRDLVVTQKGLNLIGQISEIGIEALSSPELTGQWEFQLRQMEHRRLDRLSFMNGIKDMASSIVDKTKAYVKAAKERVYPELDAHCPYCGGTGFKQTDDFYACKTKDCRLRVYKIIASRALSEEEAKTLIEKRMLGPLDGFRSKKGQEFSAAIELKEDQKTSFVFANGEDAPDGVKPFDFESAQPLCECPVCAKKGKKGLIYDTGDNYICRTSANDYKACNAKLPRVLCKKEITPENARLFFTEGRTALIEGMISKKGRPFSAFLNCKAGDKRLLSWEFPPREKKEKAPAKKAAKKLEE
ncbi:MAG: DNA topoisomerase III [Verrucomicrobiaceae bacterium]|nr:DNA topoisomerase III [Verrucomicrobiaceae bacterium]